MPNTHKRHTRKRYSRKSGENKFIGRHIHKVHNRNHTLKKENCSPKTPHSKLHYSCYTSSALHKIKTVWNMRHPDQTINSNSPREIWFQLKNYMQETCSRESCWLRHQCLKYDLDSSLWNKMFAPYSPKKWKKHPREWLTTVDIQKVMNQWEKADKHFEFLGPSPIDYDTHKVFGECVWEELCKFSLRNCKRRGITKVGIIFNLDKHTQSGSHWVAVYLDLVKHKIYYFDSYGDDIPDNILKFCETVVIQGSNFREKYEILVSRKRHQYSNSECGMYCLYFIIQMLNGTKFQKFQKIKIKDSVMLKKRKKYFNSQ